MDSATHNNGHSPPDPDVEEKKIGGPDPAGVLGSGDLRDGDLASLKDGKDVLALQDLDPALNMKMHLVNNVRSRDTLSYPDSPALPAIYVTVPPYCLRDHVR